MPPFAQRFNDRQTQDLVAYIRSLGPDRAAKPAGPANDFDARFRQLEEEWKELQKQLREIGPPPNQSTRR
jgi:hypothetical protein